MQPWVGITCTVDEQGYRLGQEYVRAIDRAGGLAAVLPFVDDVERLLSSLNRFDAIILSGGSDIDPLYFGEDVLPENGYIQPERDRFELAVARHALSQGVPVLGICRGMQVLNVAAGGALYQDIYVQTASRLQHIQQAPRWYATHSVEVESGTLLHQIVGATSIRVNTFHHQGVRRLGEGLVVSARSPDGIVEAIEAPGHPFAIGVQWHPECMAARDAQQQALFDAFVVAASQRREAA